MNPKTVNVTYTGDNPCWTSAPAADWNPGETKTFSQDDAALLLTNSSFKVADPPAAKATEVPSNG